MASPPNPIVVAPLNVDAEIRLVDQHVQALHRELEAQRQIVPRGANIQPGIVVAPLDRDDVKRVYEFSRQLRDGLRPVIIEVHPEPEFGSAPELGPVPVSDGLFGSRPKPAAQPAANPVAKPAANPAAQPAANPVAKPAANPAAQPAAKPPAAVQPAANPQAAAAKPPAAAAKPQAAAAQPAANPAAQPVIAIDEDEAQVVAPLNLDDIVAVQQLVNELNPPFVFVPPPQADAPLAEAGRDAVDDFVTESMVTVNSLFAWVTRLVDWNTRVFDSFRDNLAHFATAENRRYELEEGDYFNHWIRGNGVGVEQYINGHIEIQGPLPVEIRTNINRQVRYQWLRRMIRDNGWRQDVFAPIHRYMDKWASAAAGVLSKVNERKELTIPQLLTVFDRTTIDASSRLVADFDQAVTRTFGKVDTELEKMWDQVQTRMGRTLLAEAKLLEQERDANLAPQGNVAGLSYDNHVKTLYGRLMIAIMRAYEAITEKAYPESVQAVVEREAKRVQKEEDTKRYAEQMRLVVRFKDRIRRLLIEKQSIDQAVQVNNNNNNEAKDGGAVPMVVDQLDEEGVEVDQDVPMQLLGVVDPTKMTAEELNRIADYMETLYRKYAVLKKVNDVLVSKYQNARIADFVRKFVKDKREIHKNSTRDELRELDRLLAESVGVKTAQYQPKIDLSLEIDEEKRLSLWPIQRITNAAHVPRAYGPLYHFAQMMAGAANTSLDLILTRIFPDIESGSTLWHLVMGRVEDEFVYGDRLQREQQFQRYTFEKMAKLRDLRKKAAENPFDPDLQEELRIEDEKMYRDNNRDYNDLVETNGVPLQTNARHRRDFAAAAGNEKEFNAADLDAFEEKLMALMATPEQKEEAQKELRQKRLLQIRVGVDALRRLNQCNSLVELLRYLPEFYVPTASYAVMQMHEFVKSNAKWRNVPLHELMFADVVSLRFAALCGTHMLLYAMENSAEKLDLHRYELARKNHDTNAFQFFGNKLHRKKEYQWEAVYST